MCRSSIKELNSSEQIPPENLINRPQHITRRVSFSLLTNILVKAQSTRNLEVEKKNLAHL
jgi:hypothetical protein